MLDSTFVAAIRRKHPWVDSLAWVYFPLSWWWQSPHETGTQGGQLGLMKSLFFLLKRKPRIFWSIHENLDSHGTSQCYKTEMRVLTWRIFKRTYREMCTKVAGCSVVWSSSKLYGTHHPKIHIIETCSAFTCIFILLEPPFPSYYCACHSSSINYGLKPTGSHSILSKIWALTVIKRKIIEEERVSFLKLTVQKRRNTQQNTRQVETQSSITCAFSVML